MIGLPQPAFPLPAASSANMGSAQPYLLKPRSLFCSYQPFPKHPCSSLTCLFLPITNPIELGFFSATLKVGFKSPFCSPNGPPIACFIDAVSYLSEMLITVVSGSYLLFPASSLFSLFLFSLF